MTVVMVSPTSTAVRPPTSSHDHATARKITAATSTQVAPSPSRILGTEAALRPAGGMGGAVEGVAGAGYGTAYDIEWRGRRRRLEAGGGAVAERAAAG